MITLKSVGALAQTHQTRLGSYATHPSPSEAFGQPIALRRIEKLADCADIALKKARRMVDA